MPRPNRRAQQDAPHGVLLLDKPRGCTSHDMVALTRRALGTRAVGHAGTLDPMATGLLVLLVGEATKLAPYLSGEDKLYDATVRLGQETDTLDAEGQVVEQLPVPADLSRATVESAAACFSGLIAQHPPAVSAIKRDGVALYKRVRRGETVQPVAREVEVHELSIIEVRADEIDLRIRCGKGFYVRSLARDLARALGTAGHLAALRRLRSGAFDLSRAVDEPSVRRAAGDAESGAQLRARLTAPADCCGTMPKLTLTETGCEDAFHGRPIAGSQVASGSFPPGSETRVALLDGGGRLIAIASVAGDELQVERGFRYL